MRLKELRKQNKKTQEDMAKLLNITHVTYGRYELETSEPNIETLIKLADYYNVSLDYLIGRDFKNDFGYLTSSQRNLINLISDFDDVLCLKAEAYLEGLKDGQKETKKQFDKFNFGA